MEDGRIIKVELQFANKTYIATGKQAREWQDRIAAMERLYVSHVGSLEFKWTKILRKDK